MHTTESPSVSAGFDQSGIREALVVGGGESGNTRVTIDRDECIRCGSCWAVCPEVFEDDWDDGYSRVVEKYRTDAQKGEGVVPPEMEDCVREAAEDCPVEIIQIG